MNRIAHKNGTGKDKLVLFLFLSSFFNGIIFIDNI